MILSFRYCFEAAHRFINTNTKCSTPHGHSWWVTLSLSHKASVINLEKNFTQDFKILKYYWKRFVDEELDHFFFLNSKDPLIKALNIIDPNLRIKETPGDPTTEVLASLLFKKAENLFKNNTFIIVDSILIQETSTNSVKVYKKDVDHFLKRLNITSFKNWWS